MKHILNTAKVGDVWALALEEDDFGYVRIFRGCLGVLPVVSREIVPDANLLTAYPARWFFGFVAPPNDETRTSLIGVLPFANEDEAWPPPRFLPPDVFKDYFQIQDRGFTRRATEAETQGLQAVKISTPEWLRQFILEHRRECALIYGNGRIVPTALRGELQPAPEITLLEVVFNTSEFPFSGRDVVEDRLAEALAAAKVGEITGAGGGLHTCAIEVEVTDVTRGLALIRKTLWDLGCPAGTEIHQHEPKHVVHRL